MAACSHFRQRSKPIRFISSGVAGGLTDVVSRVVADRMNSSGDLRGQQVLVENKPGAAGILASVFVARSPADGYTVAIADLTQTAIVPALYANSQYQPQRDFVPISLLGTTPFFLGVSASLGVKSLAEFNALVRVQPGRFSYGTSGTGSVHHLATETLKTRLGLSLVHVPYKSSGQSTPALIAGDIQVLFTAIDLVLPHIKAGKVQLLGVASAAARRKRPMCQRSPNWA